MIEHLFLFFSFLFSSPLPCPTDVLFIYRNRNLCAATNRIRLRAQNATCEMVLCPNARATSLFPVTTVALFQVVKPNSISSLLRHFSRPYCSSPTPSLFPIFRTLPPSYHHCTITSNALERGGKRGEKETERRIEHLKRTTKCISIKFYFNRSTLHVVSCTSTKMCVARSRTNVFPL